MTVYRMHRMARHAADYRGAMLAGGRWNRIGAAMLYGSSTLSLACLEILVHLDRREIPREYGWSRAEVADTAVDLVCADLESVSACQAVGSSWLEGTGSLAARVQSVIVPEELNILLNPRHGRYAHLRWTEAQTFRFDPRLFTLESESL